MARKYRSWKFITGRRSSAGGPPRHATKHPVFWAQCQQTVAEVAARSFELEQSLAVPDGDVPVIVAVCPEAMNTCAKLGLDDDAVAKNLRDWRSTKGNVRNWFFLAVGASEAVDLLGLSGAHQSAVRELLETRQMVVVVGADGESGLRLIEGRQMPPQGVALIASLQPRP